MENINLNTAGGSAGAPDKGKITPVPSPTDQTKPATGLPVTGPVSSAKPDSISINFTPVIPETVKIGPVNTDKAQVAGPSVTKASGMISLEVKREDLKKEEAKTESVTAATEKKGLFGGLFGKKTDLSTKPSSAWGGSLDVNRDVPSKPAATTAPTAAPVAGSGLTISAPISLSKPVIPNAAAPVAAASPAPSAPVMNIGAPAAASGISLKAPAAAEKKDFFTSSALQEKAGTSKLMENIVTQKAQLEQPKMEDLLGKKSTILEKSIEQESQLKMTKKLRFMQFMAFVMLILVLGVNGYLYYQLSPGLDLMGYANFNFDSNLRNEVYNLNQSLKSVQTSLNKYRYLSGQLYLNQFGYESTRFLDGLSYMESPGLATDKNIVQSVVTEAKTNMPTMLAGAKENLSKPIIVETYPTRGEAQVTPEQTVTDYEAALKQAILDEKKSKMETNAQGNLDIPASAMAFYDNSIKLVGNSKLAASLRASTVEALRQNADDYETVKDPAQRAAFKKFIDDLLASTKVNLATITDLKNSRLQWKKAIDRIEEITSKVNNDHNNGASSLNGSVITYSNFDLNSDTGKVSISGLNTTQSGTNREVVTYLMEAFEASPEFKNVTNRTFPLSKSVGTDGKATYTVNFKLDMELEKGAFTNQKTTDADLQGQKVAVVKVPVKRHK